MGRRARWTTILQDERATFLGNKVLMTTEWSLWVSSTFSVHLRPLSSKLVVNHSIAQSSQKIKDNGDAANRQSMHKLRSGAFPCILATCTARGSAQP
jgi:hypothetical protein